MAAPTFVQVATIDGSNKLAGESATATLGAPPTAGNLLVFFAGAGTNICPSAGLPITSPTGWNLLETDASGTSRAWVYWKISRGAADQAVTVRNDSGTNLGVFGALGEYAGLASVPAIDAAIQVNIELPNAGSAFGPNETYSGPGPRVNMALCFNANSTGTGFFCTGTSRAIVDANSRQLFFGDFLHDAGAGGGSDQGHFCNTNVANSFSYGVSFKGIPAGFGFVGEPGGAVW